MVKNNVLYNYIMSSLGNYTYVIDGSNTVYNVGQNDYGQLGLGNTDPQVYTDIYRLSNSATLNALNGTIKYICNNGEFSIVLMADGTVYGIGDNSQGQLGLGDRLTKTSWQLMPLPTGKTASRIACGELFTIVMMTDGTVYGTGYNTKGQLGTGTTDPYKTSLTRTIMPAGKLASKIYCGKEFTIVLMTDKTVYGTGANGSGQLGIGNFTQIITSLSAMNIPSGKIPSKIACGSDFTMILMLDNTIYGTGSNAYGQFGNGGQDYSSYSLMASTIPSGKIPMKITCGLGFTVVLMLDETLYGTGNGSSGELGLGGSGSSVTNFTSIPLPSGKSPTNISCNCTGSFTSVLMVDETVYSTGSNFYGQLGFTGNIRIYTLTQMPLYGTKPTQIFTGSLCTFLQMYDGVVYATGHNNYTQLGVPIGAYLGTEIAIPSGKTPFLVAAAQRYAVMLMTDGSIYGTGDNSAGQLGTGNTTSVTSLTAMDMSPTTGKTPYKIACGVNFTVVLMTDGSIYGTGSNSGGQLANITSLSSSVSTLGRMNIPSGKTPVNIACGNTNTLVLMSDGTLYGTGSNLNGQGNTYTTLTSIPLPIGKTAIKIVCGSSGTSSGFTVVLMNDNTIYGMGFNTYGQLGTGSSSGFINSLTLMTNTTGKIPAKISCGANHTIVLMKDGSMYGTGFNGYGQLGNGTFTDSSTLTAMSGISGKIPLSISSGADFTFVVMKDGTMYGTGANAYSQLSTGDTNTYNTLQQTRFSYTTYASNIVYIMNTSVVNTIINVASSFNATFGDAPFPLNATTNNNQTPIVYTSANTNIATVDSSGIVTIVPQAQSVSSVAISLFQDDTADFNSGTASTTINVRYNSIITVASTFNKVYGDNSFSLDASSNNNQAPITYVSDSSAVTVNSSGIVTIVSATDASYATITLSQISTQDYNSGSTTTRIYIAKKTTVITVDSSFNKVYGANPFSLGATTNGNPSPYTYVSDSSAVTVNSSGVVTIVSATDASYATITISQIATTNYTSGTATTRIYVAKKTTVITVDASFNKVYGTDVSFNLNATSNGNPATITYSSDSSAVTVNSSGVVTIVSATGSSYATITLSQVSNTNYTSGTATTLIYVAKKTTVITVDASFNKIYGASPFPLDASSNGNPSPLVYTADSSAVTIASNGTVTILSAVTGYVTVTISQVTSTNYTSGTTSTLIYIAKQQTVVNVDASFNKVYGDASFNLDASSNNTESPFSYVPDSSAVTIASNGVVTINSAVTGYVNVVVSKAASTNYTDGSANTQIYIAKQPTVIHVDASFNKVYGDASFNLNATSNNIEANITYLSDSSAVTVDASGNVTIVSAINGSYATITLSQESTTDYTSATATTRIYVAQKTTVITVDASFNKVYGDASFNLGASSNGNPASIVYTSDSSAVTVNENGDVTIVSSTGGSYATITLTQVANNDYTSGTSTTRIYVVNQQTVINVDASFNKIYGDDPFPLGASTNNNETNITYSSDNSAVTVDSSGWVTIVSATGDTYATITLSQEATTNYSSGSTSTRVYVTRQQTVINVDASFNVVYGDPSFNLNATSNNTESAFSYVPDSSAVTISSDGIVTINSAVTGYVTVTISKAMSTDYTSGSTTTRIYIVQQQTAIVVDASFNKIYGDAPFNLNATSNNTEAVITYRSNTPSVSVDASGNVTILSAIPTYATITLSQVETTDYTSDTTTTRIYVAKQQTVINVDASFNKIYGDDPFSLGATSNNTQAVFTYSANSSAVTVSTNGIVTINSAVTGYVTVTISKAASTNYTDGSANTLIYITKQQTVIRVDASFNVRYGVSSFSLDASTNNSQTPIMYTSDSSAVSVNSQGTVTILGAVDPYATITLTQDASSNYTNGTATTLIYVAKVVTNITVDASFNKVYGDASFNLGASSNNTEAPITYSSNSSAVTVDASGRVTIVSATDSSYAIITLSQISTTNYTSGTTTTQIYVAQQQTVINVATTFNKVYENSPFPLGATSNNNAVITYDSNSSAVTVDSSGWVTIVSATDSSYAIITLTQQSSLNYTSGTTTTQIYVAKANATLTNSSISLYTKYAGNQPFSLSPSTNNTQSAINYNSSNTAVATVNSSGVITIVSATGATPTAPVSVIISMSQNANINYNASNVMNVTVNVYKANTTINVASTFTRAYGANPFSLGATSNNPSAISYVSGNTNVVTVDASGVVTIVNAGTATITLSQSDTSDFYAGTASTTITVTKLTPTITVTSSISKMYGDASFNLDASSTNVVTPITYSSSNTGIATVNSSGVVTIISAGTAIITSSQVASTNYNSASATSTITVTKKTIVVSVSPTSATLLPSVNLNISSYVTCTPSTNVTITYTSGTPTVATVGASNGAISYVGLGSSIITITASPSLSISSLYSATTATFTVSYSYSNINTTDASNNVLTQINTIKQISGGYNTNTTTYKYANCCGLDASSNLMVVGYQASPTSNIGRVAISRNNGSTWLPCTMPVTPSNITDVCFKGVSTSAYCAIYGTGQKMMYASIDISTNFVLNTSSSASTISGVRFASSGTTPCTNSSGICLAGITTYTLKGTSGFSGSMPKYFANTLNACCFDSPDDNADYSIYGGQWGTLQYCRPNATYAQAVAAFPTPTSVVYAIATSSGLAKTLYMTSSATYLLSNLNLTTGNGTYTLLSTGATGKLPSTCGSGVTGNLMRICSMSLNGNVMAVIDAKTIVNGNVSKACYYSVNGGTTWINLTARFNINDTFVSVQVSRDGNYILLQAVSCLYKLALSS